VELKIPEKPLKGRKEEFLSEEILKEVGIGKREA